MGNSWPDFTNAWQVADKVSYSMTLDVVSTVKTRLERTFDPTSLRNMKAPAASDLTVGARTLLRTLSGPGWSMSATCSSVPSSLGGGKPALPGDMRAALELLDDRRLGNGVVYLRYRIPT